MNQMWQTKFRFPAHGGSIWNLALIGQVGLRVSEKMIFNGFYIFLLLYGHGGHLGHVTQMRRTNFCSHYPLRLFIKFGFDWASGFWGEYLWSVWTTDNKDFTNCIHCLPTPPMGRTRDSGDNVQANKILSSPQCPVNAWLVLLLNYTQGFT